MPVLRLAPERSLLEISPIMRAGWGCLARMREHIGQRWVVPAEAMLDQPAVADLGRQGHQSVQAPWLSGPSLPVDL